MKKIAKIKKQPHAHKGHVSTYNFEILNSFNPELQLKNTEFQIKNELKKLFTEFVATLVCRVLKNRK